MISLSDPQFQNKAIIIQIMGTWCPNCMDETKFLSNWYNTEAPSDVAIIGLNYERNMDTAYVNPAIRRLQSRFAIKYPILFAGNSDRAEVVKTLPMLDRIAGFPTTIYIDKHGKVKEIHTGFNGPATGKLYLEYQTAFKELIESLRK
ncbi:MAG: TlpA family protein disulfide reductase [Bacteroidetes bacterium]|nr:TlpA family protein disulfide reductase [Bacteroidota bacterium]